MNTIVDWISGVVSALTATASINRFIKSTEERLKSSNQMSRRSYEMLDWEIHQILGAGPFSSEEMEFRAHRANPETH